MMRIYVAIPSGQAPKIEYLKKQNIDILSINICGNYERISTICSEISLLSGEW